MESNSNKSLSGAMCDMCHYLIGRKSKVMNKRIRKSKGTNRRLTCGKGGHSHLIMLDQTGGRRRRKEREKKEKRKRNEREEEGRERSSTFSLVFPAIGPSVFVRVRMKVLPHGKSFK